MTLNRSKKLYIVGFTSVAYVCMSHLACFWGEKLLLLEMAWPIGFDRMLCYLDNVIVSWEWLLYIINIRVGWSIYFADPKLFWSTGVISSAILAAVTILLVRRWERLFLPIVAVLGFLTLCWTGYLIYYVREYARLEPIVRMQPST